MYELLIHTNLEKQGYMCHSVDNGIYGLDMFDRVIYWNIVMEQLTGIHHSTCYGKKVYELFPFLKEIGEHSYINKAKQGRTIHIKDRPYLTPSLGVPGKFEATYFPVSMEDDKIVGTMIVIKDLGKHVLMTLSL